MATRPQTLYGLADSPVDLAAFMLDHGDGTCQPGLVTQVLDGTLQGDLTRDDLLDNITLYWLTNTGVSAARLYWENTAGFFDAKPITIPVAISVFPDELYRPPGAGPGAPTRPTSSTTTGSTAAATSPPGNNPNCWPRSSGPPSGPPAATVSGASPHPPPPPPRDVNQRRADQQPTCWEPRSPPAPRVKGSRRTDAKAAPTPLTTTGQGATALSVDTPPVCVVTTHAAEPFIYPIEI